MSDCRKGAGNLQQQAAAAGAIQAISYCPTMGPAFARTVAANGAIHPLVDMLSRGPVAMRCAAAGALCNLSLGCPDNQVGRHRRPGWTAACPCLWHSVWWLGQGAPLQAECREQSCALVHAAAADAATQILVGRGWTQAGGRASFKAATCMLGGLCAPVLMSRPGG